MEFQLWISAYSSTSPMCSSPVVRNVNNAAGLKNFVWKPNVLFLPKSLHVSLGNACRKKTNFKHCMSITFHLICQLKIIL